MAKNSNQLVASYIAGIGNVEELLSRRGEHDFEQLLDHALEASAAATCDADLARAAGVTHALVHAKQQGVLKSNPRRRAVRSRSDKHKAAIERSKTVLKRAHAILGEKGCSFKAAMVQAWTEAKGIKANSNKSRGMTPEWAAAQDGEAWAQYEMERTGRAYNVPAMGARDSWSYVPKKNSGRGMDALWRQAQDGQDWAQFEMARTGRAYNVPAMYANRGLKKGQNNMARAAAGYRAGKYSSMQEALSAESAKSRGE